VASTSPWAGWLNAEIYDAFVEEFGIYRALNRRLAALAEVASARRVLDLACGGGATALACLARMPARSELLGVDGSEAMVRVARARVRDPRARFRVAAASDLERVLSGPFDRAVSNAAFWQFPDPRTVLAAVGRVLAPGGLFVFNVPAERLVGEDAPVTPFQVALARAIEARSGHPFPTPEPLDPRRLSDELGEAGFELLRRDRFAYSAHQVELMELMSIPAMIRRVAPELPEDERQAALAEARSRTDPEQRVTVPWVYWVARLRADGPRQPPPSHRSRPK
jgi:SAM-dependent methyltransferase